MSVSKYLIDIYFVPQLLISGLSIRYLERSLFLFLFHIGRALITLPEILLSKHLDFESYLLPEEGGSNLVLPTATKEPPVLFTTFA